MKNSAIWMLSLVIIGVFIYTISRPSEDNFNVPDGYLLISSDSWDSIKKIAELPPDTIRVDSFIFLPKLVYIGNQSPIPVAIAPGENIYADSVKTDSLDIWWTAKTQGILDYHDLWYQIKLREVFTTINNPVPYPVEVKVKVIVPQNGFYLTGGIGGGLHTGKFSAGIGLDMVTKKQQIYGIQYQRMGSENIVMFKAGIKISKDIFKN